MPHERSGAGDWLNQLPIVVMSAGWLAPLPIFWLAVWGPLRSYDLPGGGVRFAFPTFLFVLSASALASRVSHPYFHTRAFERSGRLYELLGVRHFRRVVPDGDWSNRFRRQKDRRFRIIRSRADAATFVQRTEASERGHLALFVAGLGSSAYAYYIGWFAWALLLGAGNVLVNLYPILLQRYTRCRIARALRL